MRLFHAVAAAVMLLSAPALAQRQQQAAIPLPPPRPFDLDKTEWLPEALRNPGAANPALADGAEPEEDEFPRTAADSPAEPLFDPAEAPDRPGLSTDKGTSIDCVPARLRVVLDRVIERFGAVRVTSTWRPPKRARRNSWHRRCEAVDFRAPGVHPQTIIAFVRDMPEVGGRKVYWNGLIHIDTGPVRTW